MSFNIRCCNDKDGNSIPERAPRLNKIASKYNADIIGFQEVRPQWIPYINEYYSRKYNIFNKYRSEKNDLESSPILWQKNRFNLVKTGNFWLSDTPQKESRGWDEKYNSFRMCVYAVLKDKYFGKAFTVMNTHFGFGDSVQVKSANLIYRYSKKISTYPTLIIGDFNMTPDSIGYRTMKQRFVDVNSVTVNDLRSTYHGYNPEKIKDKHIDYCFIDNSITPLSYKIIDDLPDGKFPSDHFGIFAELRI